MRTLERKNGCVRNGEVFLLTPVQTKLEAHTSAELAHAHTPRDAREKTENESVSKQGIYVQSPCRA